MAAPGAAVEQSIAATGDEDNEAPLALTKSDVQEQPTQTVGSAPMQVDGEALARGSAGSTPAAAAAPPGTAPPRRAQRLDRSKSIGAAAPHLPQNSKAAKAAARMAWKGADMHWGDGRKGKPDTPDAAEMPQGAAAVNWGFWQFFNDDGAGSSSSSEGDDNKDGVASHRAGGKDHGTWFRGRVLHYVPEQGCYWCVMEDGDVIQDLKETEVVQGVGQGEFIFCRQPPSSVRPVTSAATTAASAAEGQGQGSKRQRPPRTAGQLAAAAQPAKRARGLLERSQPEEQQQNKQQQKEQEREQDKEQQQGKEQQQQQPPPSIVDGAAEPAGTKPAAAAAAKSVAAPQLDQHGKPVAAAARQLQHKQPSDQPQQRQQRQQQQQQQQQQRQRPQQAQVDVSGLSEQGQHLLRCLQQLQEGAQRITYGLQQQQRALQVLQQATTAQGLPSAEDIVAVRKRLEVANSAAGRANQASGWELLQQLASSGTRTAVHAQQERLHIVAAEVSARLPGGGSSSTGGGEQMDAAARVPSTAAIRPSSAEGAARRGDSAAVSALPAEAQRMWQLVQRFSSLVPLRALDDDARDRAVALLSAVLHPPCVASPFTLAHQLEALLHERHGTIGAGRHMYMRHLHMLWSTLGGLELERAAAAAAHASVAAAGGAGDAARAAHDDAAAALATARAALQGAPGVADAAALRAALLDGSTSARQLFDTTGAALGFDKQRDK